jgi:ssRNA-specific RNase YbeY (16S rRNA maturation enzyme)
VDGATDVTTQRYDAMPGEEMGVYGELYVNVERAISVSSCRSIWGADKELLLYIAHGMDHLAGSDDFTEKDYLRMRRRELSWLRAVFSNS